MAPDRFRDRPGSSPGRGVEKVRGPSLSISRSAVLILALALLGSGVLHAQSLDTHIERIDVQGLYRMSEEAFLHALGLREGDPYDENQVLRRYKKLWDLGLFEDITLEGEVGKSGGMVLVLKVKERPVLTAVTYEEVKSVTKTEIDDRLRERDVKLLLGKPLDPGAVSFAEGAISDLLAEKGFLNSEVDAQVRRVTESTRAVHFQITSGGKTRIRGIDFTGNEVFKDRKLKSQLQLTEERRWYWPWSGKNLYHPGKWDQDVAAVRALYQNHGYLDVEVRPPVVDVLEAGEAKKQKKQREGGVEGEDAEDADTSEPAGPGEEGAGSAGAADQDSLGFYDDLDALPKEQRKAVKQQKKAAEQARKAEQKAKKIKRWVYLTVPVKEGPQYTTGEITVEGNEVFPEELLRALVPLKQGQVLRNDVLDYGVDQITRLYENRGHLYATVVRRLKRHEGENVADVEIAIEEDEPYFIARVEFTGNTKTHDRVLRREVLLSEGELFNRSLLDISKVKINQLGYYQVPTDPVVEPVEGENRVNVTFVGEERGRNEIQVGGGFSELDGLFFNGVYSTRNFLGRGQTLSASLQVGGRSNRYQIAFTEPWFLSRPITAGFSIFNRESDYGDSLRSTSRGLGFVLGKRVRRFSRVNLAYNWQSVSSRTVLRSIDGDVDSGTTSTITTENKISSLTPLFSVNTINNPQRPTRGKSFSASLQIAGGPLGGDTSFLKPILNYIQYRRLGGRHYLGFRAQAGWVREWQDGSTVLSSTIEGVPRFERFWLGGDTLGPRVFETRSITPLRYVEVDGDGNIVDVIGDPRFIAAGDLVTSGGIPVLIEVGGDRFYLLQTEYVIPFGQQAEMALFLDMGDALFEDQHLNFDTMRASVGVEVRFYLPIFPVPLRLIYGVPVRDLDQDRSSSFTFSIGRAF
jgi:outer membrane protein assembly complex protein YaeT